MRSPGKLDHPARQLDGKAGVDLGDNLLSRVSVFRVVDYGLSRNPCAAHDWSPGHYVGLGLDI
jgi:hypothetical protein